MPWLADFKKLFWWQRQFILHILVTKSGIFVVHYSLYETYALYYIKHKYIYIVIDNKIIEQVNSFNYLGNVIFYEKELDIDKKVQNYLKITGIINNVFRPQKPLKNKNKLYNTLALPVLLYGSETWTIQAWDARRISAAEMKYMRRTAGYTWTDYKTNLHIAKEL